LTVTDTLVARAAPTVPLCASPADTLICDGCRTPDGRLSLQVVATNVTAATNSDEAMTRDERESRNMESPRFLSDRFERGGEVPPPP